MTRARSRQTVVASVIVAGLFAIWPTTAIATEPPSGPEPCPAEHQNTILEPAPELLSPSSENPSEDCTTTDGDSASDTGEPERRIDARQGSADTGDRNSETAAVRDLDCKDFATREEAQAELDRDRDDPNRLDRDNDGIACERLPGRATPPPAEDRQQVSVHPVGGVATGGAPTGNATGLITVLAAFAFGGAAYCARHLVRRRSPRG